MPRTRPDLVQLSPAALGELLKPARLELIECLQLHGPSSAASLGQRLGRPADRLYYHLRKLVEIGVVREREAAEGAGEPGRNGAVFALTAKCFGMRLDARSAESRAAWSRGAGALLRQAQREVDAALACGAARSEGSGRNLVLRRIKVQVGRRELAEIQRRLDELFELVSALPKNPRGTSHVLTVVTTPLAVGQN